MKDAEILDKPSDERRVLQDMLLRHRDPALQYILRVLQRRACGHFMTEAILVEYEVNSTPRICNRRI